MANIYQKLYRTHRRQTDQPDYAFITYTDESNLFSIVKSNRLINLDTNGYGTLKNGKDSYQIQLVEKGYFE